MAAKGAAFGYFFGSATSNAKAKGKQQGKPKAPPPKKDEQAWVAAGMPCLIKEVLYAPPCPEPVSLLWEVALTHQNNGSYDLAIKTYLEGQLVWEHILAQELEAEGKVMPPEYAPPLPIVGQLFLRLAVASVFDSAAVDEKALAELMEAQRICNGLPPTHPIQAMIDSMLGIVYVHLSQFDLAADHFIRALEVRENTLGTDHLDTGLTLNNVGVALHCLDRTSDALVMYYKAEEIFRNGYPVENPRLVAVTQNIGRAKQSYLKASNFKLPDAKPLIMQLSHARIKAMKQEAKLAKKARKQK
eukprot:TRINITY_DN11580_c0_g3_i1.p1 TRINITY_DN11580_c0_g3~~TRINITY_DN11580_c0_g3_i1.p1  ORF type:complete len:301 (+),score=121.99 TRINITY_DN11580_c0_g3_i1:76-978(+)